MQRSNRLLALGLLTLTTTACLSGPRAFQASHALHNEALRARLDEELLLNLVRLRYRDSPLFLQVGSVVTQFEVTGSLSTGASLEEANPSGLAIDAEFGWSEQPTYTFTPLQDDEFVRRLLTPIDLELVVLLQRSGWSIERVLRLAMQSFGGLENAASASGPTPRQAPVFAEFLHLTKLLRTLQQQGRIQLVFAEGRADLSVPVESSAVQGSDFIDAAQNDLRFEVVEGSPSQLVLTRGTKSPMLLVSPAAVESKEVQELVSMLGLNPGHDRYELSEGAWSGAGGDARSSGVIGVNARSLLGAFFYLSHGIDVPAGHVEAGLVTITRDAEGRVFDWRELTGEVLRVKTSPRRPATAATAVPYRGHWFYIDDSDLESKSTFALLLELFNMSADTSFDGGPTLTLPIGG